MASISVSIAASLMPPASAVTVTVAVEPSKVTTAAIELVPVLSSQVAAVSSRQSDRSIPQSADCADFELVERSSLVV